MTNYEWLKSLSIEDMAKVIGAGTCDNQKCPYRNCKGIEKWLNQEQNPLPSFEIADVIETVNNRYVVIWENTVIGVKGIYSTTIPAYICPIDDVLTHETVTTIWRYNQKEKLFEKIWRDDNGNQ